MKVTSLLLAAAAARNYTACTGTSASLPESECMAWQDFFDELDGPHWTAFGSEGRADPCSVKSKIGNPCKGDPAMSGSHFTRGLTKQKPGCDVHGEPDLSLPPWQEPDAGVCCKDGHITQLAFALNGLKGPMPDSMNDFVMLDDFSACGNEITSLPKDMSATKVGFLRLHVNKITGPLPASYSNMTNMEYISLSDNFITGPLPDFSNLPKLRGAYLDCNKFSGAIPTSWSGKVVSDFKACFLSEGVGETCTKGYADNTLSCPIPTGADKNCHVKCK
jgi:hypothetical protein